MACTLYGLARWKRGHQPDLGAMACHYLDGVVIIAACAMLLDKILPAAA
ncbi:MAG TPA: hypothetical protein VN767_07000 [Streptosporangiaceae bacterium]|nr:hypothetical protein [Streptosporangiaceae bacterium]